MGNENWERNSQKGPHLVGDQPVWEPPPGVLWQKSLLSPGGAEAAQGRVTAGLCAGFCRNQTEHVSPPLSVSILMKLQGLENPRPRVAKSLIVDSGIWTDRNAHVGMGLL